MEEKQSSEKLKKEYNSNIVKNFRYSFIFIIILYILSLSKFISYVNNNKENLPIYFIVLGIVIFLLGLYYLYKQYLVLFKNSSSNIDDIAKNYKQIKKRNLEFQEKMPLNIFKYFGYNKNKTDSSEFVFFGTGKINFILFILMIIPILYISFKSGNFKYLIILFFGIILVYFLTAFSVNNTAAKQLEFDKKLEENINKGIKPGVLDTLNLKSIILVIIIGFLIALGILFLFALTFYLFD